MRSRKTSQRFGKILILTLLLLPVLLGQVGLTIDVGLLMATRRQAQNAADAGAMAAAMDLLRGKSVETAMTTGATFVRQYNGLQDAVVQIHIPPSSGPYAGNGRYVEVLVSYSMSTWFIQTLGVSSTQSVAARAVAGFEAVSAGAGLIALSDQARPGLSVSGTGSIVLNGRAVINSAGGGVDENGQPINNGNTGYAASVGNGATLLAKDIQVVGGVNNPANFRNYDPAAPGSPLHCGTLPEPDPLLYLPTPTSATGVDPTYRGSVSVSGNDAVTLWPGVYSSISISGGMVIFQPGIYVLKPDSNTTTTLKITGGDVSGQGVMFYNTGSNFDLSTGWPDTGDRSQRPPASDGASFGGVTINTGVQFSPLQDQDSPFDGMLFLQRRLNTEAVQIEGNSSAGKLTGTLYAPWGELRITGQGTYDAQFITGKVTVSGTGDVTVNYAGKGYGKANQVFLVE